MLLRLVTLKILILCVGLLQAETEQQTRTAPASTSASIPSSSEEDTAPTPPPTPETPTFQIESTQTKLLEVTEAPPLPDLPPVTGTITLKVHAVADPGLPPVIEPPFLTTQEITEPNAAESETDPQAESRIAYISATVYNHSRTLITCQLDGSTDKAITAWSNLDFNHFSGFPIFQATTAQGTTRSYALFMGVGNETITPSEQQSLPEDSLHKIPNLPDGTPTFLVETKNPDPETLTLLEDLHALYRSEGTQMANAHAAREKAYQTLKNQLLAHPPEPKDVTIHFWKREPSTSNEEATQP
jgi:hypothetical protein